MFSSFSLTLGREIVFWPYFANWISEYIRSYSAAIFHFLGTMRSKPSFWKEKNFAVVFVDPSIYHLARSTQPKLTRKTQIISVLSLCASSRSFITCRRGSFLPFPSLTLFLIKWIFFSSVFPDLYCSIGTVVELVIRRGKIRVNFKI